jgi:hypothetical protein
MLMDVVTPLWLAAGFADYLCHRTPLRVLTASRRIFTH